MFLGQALALQQALGDTDVTSARDVLVGLLLECRDWDGTWRTCTACPDGAGGTYGRLLAATGKASAAEATLGRLGDACLRTNRFVPSVLLGDGTDGIGTSGSTDPGSRHAAAVYVDK